MPSPPLSREDKILVAAMAAFSRYGFARTTMDDLARAAGIARTALYKIYRNKEHIFRALAEAVHGQALALAEEALKRDRPFSIRITEAMIARDMHLLQIGHTGPHADEIAELYLELAGDLAARSNALLEDGIAGATAAAVRSGEFTLPAAFNAPEDFARLARLALEGVKKEVKEPVEFERLARQLLAALCSSS